ncbi:P-loop containing nucleoside triphosphate hydrolase protein [Suillus paluster]|uniref:P-loop containing nucleoside triphosphate hydrolase protein n=1 Tax=Suillus paluster TaxID=48578 RepID=UPI001B878D20|nr:P-loop containing nucleoside triphosphate hydrolase protein [Suillus paluster]KAG1732891.1 P-loop containing nucleoside triphosphate hydrolase protein [Suillus paluster]
MATDEQKSQQGCEVAEAALPRSRIARYDEYFDQRTFATVYRKTSKPTKKLNHKKPVLIVRRIIDHKGRHVQTEIDIRSLALCEVLTAIHKDVDGLELMRSAPVCEPELLFFSYDGLKDRLEKEMSKDPRDEALIADINVAIQYIQEDHAGNFADLQSLIADQSITFDLLWALFPANTLVFNHHQYTEQRRILKAQRFLIRERKDRSVYAEITCDIVVNDGNIFGIAQEPIEIDAFKGTRKIYELPVFPLRFYHDQGALCEHAIQRGRKFAGLVAHAYGEISGPALREVVTAQDKIQFRKFNTYGRVMIDPAGFRVFQPNCSFNLTVYRRLNRDELTDEQHMICTPVVLGFCFGVKEWGGFALDRLQDIAWSQESFDSLVLGPKQKSLIHALVKQHESQTSQFDDIVQGKGKGLVGLLAGPPGCGKTLTAEAVAEVTRRPLYYVSAGELGTDAKAVDKALIQILELAQKWKAVLLLDEADVFLYQRSSNDVIRNALVSIFLRQLEYYQGILFLTTNMIAQCDLAFESRIHFTVHFPQLNESSRRQIWKTFIAKTAGAGSITDDEIDALAKESMNGRQIKNTISTAQSISFDQNSPLSAEHIRTVLEVARDWSKARGEQSLENQITTLI